MVRYQIVMVCLSLCSTCTCIAQDNSKDESRRVNATDKKFSIIPPIGWEKDGNTTAKGTILSREPSTRDSNLIVKLSYVPKGLTFMEHSKKTVEDLKKRLMTYDLLEEDVVTIAEREAYFVFLSTVRKEVKLVPCHTLNFG